MKSSFADILEGLSEREAKKVRSKLPSWAGLMDRRAEGSEQAMDAGELVIPSSLSLEQCSSEATALWKASVAAGLCGVKSEAENWLDDNPGENVTRHRCPRTIVDLTGGLGVDSWAFSHYFRQVLYHEANESLVQAARHNFSLMGCDNIRVSQGRAEDILDRDNITISKASAEDLIGNTPARPDIIYLDPSRRSDSGRKLVLIEDCSPDVHALESKLLAAAPRVLVKLSPMLDLTGAIRSFPHSLTRIFIVGYQGECKEILLLLERGCDSSTSVGSGDGSGLRDINVVELGDATPGRRTTGTSKTDGSTLPTVQILTFTPSEARQAATAFTDLSDCTGPSRTVLPGTAPPSGAWIFEPGAALMKSACWGVLCRRFGLVKLGRSTHLFECADPIDALRPFGRFRKIIDVRPFSGKALKALGRDFPRCELSARNIPMTTEQLRARTGTRSGGDVYIYACTADLASSSSARLLLICERD